MTTTEKPQLDYPFTEAEAISAHEAWGCNCGPTALAFALQCGLDEVRPLIPGFEEKRFTSPTMMRLALQQRGQRFFDVRPAVRASMFQPTPALVRIQWTGPWTQPGANPRWAYRQTHWIATWRVDGQIPRVFDVNGGAMTFTRWCREIVPLIAASVARADGGWEPTHIWALQGGKANVAE